MKLERSAGFVMFRQASDAPRQYLLLDYGKHWDYAKGHVEKGEDDFTAACRELMEETGISQVDRVGDFRAEIDYVFRNRNGGMIRKTVVFFIGKTEQKNIILSEEHVGYTWLPFDEAMKKLTYTNARQLLTKAEAFLNSMQK